MKKSYLAAAAILGAAVFAGQAHAVKIDLGKGKSFKFGFRGKIEAGVFGARYDRAVEGGDDTKTDLRFRVPNGRIYGVGSISKIFKWAWQVDLRPGPGDFRGSEALRVVDNFIVLDFAKELKFVAGWFKVPFELHSGIQSGWSYVMPLGPAYGLKNTGAGNPFDNPAQERAQGSGSRSPLAGIWGKVADGMFKYYLYVTDGNNETGVAGEAQTGFGARIELAPTMLGYKGHPGAYLRETYVGKQNTLVLGLSYFTQNYRNTDDATSWGIDLLWEQNMGAITPNISIGYVDHKNFRGTANRDLSGILVQGQVLFNYKTILGKPAIGVRWAQSDPDNAEKAQVLGVVGQLYVKGVGNRIALSIENVKDDNAQAPKKDSYTDVVLSWWYNF